MSIQFFDTLMAMHSLLKQIKTHDGLPGPQIDRAFWSNIAILHLLHIVFLFDLL